MSAAHFPADAIIFREGDKSNEAYYVVSGNVEISIDTEHGPHTLANLGPGEIFGEMGMINDRPRSATAKATESTMVEIVDESVFESQILQRPDRLHTYLATLFERLRKTDLQLRMVETAAPTPAPKPATPDVHYRVTLRSCYDQTGWKGAPIELEIPKFPLRIGRAYFDTAVAVFARNDLSIEDQTPFHISRNHCEIDKVGDHFVLRDRGSRLGTWVNGTHVAIDANCFHVDLKEGDNDIILGSEDSPHKFILTIERV
jgi:hypothetical protein